MAPSADLALMVNGNNRTLAAPAIRGALIGEGEVLLVAFVAAGLPRVRLHDLRHRAATLALIQGVPPKVVSDRLGHSTVGLTLDTYSHLLPAMHQQAAAAMDVILAG